MTTTAISPSEYRSNCRLCGASCGMIVETANDRVVGIRGDRDNPLTEGYICGKGRSSGLAHHDPRRFTRALMGRAPHRTDAGLADTLDDLGGRLQEIIDRHGIDAVGIYLGTQCFSDSGSYGPVMRLVSALRSRSFYTADTVDVVAKVVAALKLTGNTQTLWPPRVDFANSRLLLVFGQNTVVSHTHGGANAIVKLRRIMARGEVWVIDPQRTETAKIATRHLQIKASSDAFLLAHLLRELFRDGANMNYLSRHAIGVDTLRQAVEPHSAAITAERVGVTVDQLADLVNAIRRFGTLSVTSGTGTRMGPHPVLTEWLIYCLSIVTSSMDTVGGNYVLNRGLVHAPTWATAEAPGPRARPELRSWGGQYPCAAMADEIEMGNLKALISFGGNPAAAIADEQRIIGALRSLEVFAVNDIVPTVSTDLATHILPGTSQLEHSSVVHGITPTSRSFMQYSSAIFSAGGDCRPTAWFVNEIGQRLGYSIFSGPLTEIEAHRIFPSGTNVVESLRAAPAGMIVGDEIALGSLTSDLPNGRWDLAAEELIGQLTELKHEGPLLLIPRRQSRHVNWYLTDLEGPSGKLDGPDLIMNPEDARRCGVADGELATVSSATGQLVLRVRVTEDISPGAVSVPHGHRDSNVNSLTSTRLGIDSVSGMILQGGVAVTVRPAQS